MKALFLAGLLVALIVVSGCLEQSLPADALTLDDLYNESITNFVDKQIFLETKIAWDYGSCVHILGAEISCEEEREKISGQPTVVFDNIGQHIPSGEEELYSRIANFDIVSDKLSKVRDFFGVEQYSFNGKTLSNNGTVYVLEGVIKYRDWLEVTEENLNDPRFIEQSNNPSYWTQTFEFELVNIYE